jgi:hypothetical protein
VRLRTRRAGARRFDVSQFAAVAGHAIASLEDCLTLEVHSYWPGELYRMRLRAVQIPG